MGRLWFPDHQCITFFIGFVEAKLCLHDLTRWQKQNMNTMRYINEYNCVWYAYPKFNYDQKLVK